jgi:hypothetical protein
MTAWLLVYALIIAFWLPIYFGLVDHEISIPWRKAVHHNTRKVLLTVTLMVAVIFGVAACGASHPAAPKSSAISWCWTEAKNGSVVVTAVLEMDC